MQSAANRGHTGHDFEFVARILFEEALEKLRCRHGFFLFGYVLMHEHMHLLLGEPKLHSHAITMSVLMGETLKLLKGDRPQFWQTRYYDFNVFTQKKFAEKIDYFHSNPVTHGLVKKPENWPWSSFRHWSTGEPGRFEIESYWTWTRCERASPIAINHVMELDNKAAMNGAPGYCLKTSIH